MEFAVISCVAATQNGCSLPISFRILEKTRKSPRRYQFKQRSFSKYLLNTELIQVALLFQVHLVYWQLYFLCFKPTVPVNLFVNRVWFCLRLGLINCFGCWVFEDFLCNDCTVLCMGGGLMLFRVPSFYDDKNEK